MASHHFIGKGTTSTTLVESIQEPERLSETIKGIVASSGLSVISEKLTGFPGGGMTLVWILAESHLVLHYWAEEGFSTIDLHVCDYERSNTEKAAQLVASLDAFCFVPGSSNWQDLTIPDPQPQAAAAPTNR